MHKMFVLLLKKYVPPDFKNKLGWKKNFPGFSFKDFKKINYYYTQFNICQFGYHFRESEPKQN